MHPTLTPQVPPAQSASDLSRFRRIFVGSLIGSLCTTGLLAAIAVGAGSFGELEYRVLLTTLLVGCYSVLCLAGLVVVGGRHRWVGVAGMAFTNLALVSGLLLIWGLDEDAFDSEASLWEFVGRTFGVCAILGFGFAHASLLLHAVRRAAPAARAICGATLVAVAVVATMFASLVALTESGGGEGFWRIVGVFAILDVVGTVVTPLVARLQRSAAPAPAPSL